MKLPHAELNAEDWAHFKLFSDLFDLGYPPLECLRITQAQFEQRHRVTVEDIRRWFDLFGELPE